MPGVCMCVSGGKRKAKLLSWILWAHGPWGLFIIKYPHEEKRESYLHAWKESTGAEAGMPGSPGVGTRKAIYL